MTLYMIYGDVITKIWQTGHFPGTISSHNDDKQNGHSYNSLYSC